MLSSSEVISKLAWQVASMQEVLEAIDDVNSRRASAQVQDMTVRLDYEKSFGFCLDRVRYIVERMRTGQEIEFWKREVR